MVELNVVGCGATDCTSPHDLDGSDVGSLFFVPFIFIKPVVFVAFRISGDNTFSSQLVILLYS